MCSTREVTKKSYSRENETDEEEGMYKICEMPNYPILNMFSHAPCAGMYPSSHHMPDSHHWDLNPALKKMCREMQEKKAILTYMFEGVNIFRFGK